MIPVQFPEANAIIAAAQEEYEPLQVHIGDGEEHCVTACFRLSEAEIIEIVRSRTIYVQQLTFGEKYHPIVLTTMKPEM